MRSVVGVLGIVPMAALVMGAASSAPNMSYGDGSRIWVEGTSTVRGYECASERIDGAVITKAVSGIKDLQGSVETVNLAVPVAALDCGNGTMNGHMQKALNVQAHPFIKYTHASHTVTETQAGRGQATIKGQLEIAGKTQPITLETTVAEQAGGTLRVQGTKQLKMTDFGVKPPTLMMGTLKVHDPVTVHFDLVLKP